MTAPTRTPDTDLATALLPTMTPRPASAPVPPTEHATLYPTMTPRADPVAPTLTESSDQDTAPAATIPEAHWARVEDVEQWEADVMAGPLAASLPAARTFLQQHAPRELVQMLEQSGYGSNPHVIKFVADLAAKFTSRGIR